MLEDYRIPVIIPQGPSRKIDEIRIENALIENEEGIYIIGGSDKSRIKPMEKRLKDYFGENRVIIYNDAKSYAEIFEKIIPHINSRLFQISTNRFGVKRFNLYNQSAIKEGLLEKSTKIGELRTQEPLKTLFLEILGLYKDKKIFEENSFSKGLELKQAKGNKRIFGKDIRSFFG